jgi:hypothetical protein
MLNPRHDKRVIGQRITFCADGATPRDVLAQLRALRQPPAAGGSELLRDRSAAFAIEEFARRHMHVRDDLAWRAAKGEALTAVERATLHALDAVLDEIEPASSPVPAEAQQILRDLFRR